MKKLNRYISEQKKPDLFPPKKTDLFPPKKNDLFDKDKPNLFDKDEKKSGTTEPPKPKERVVDLKKCKKSIDDFYPDKEKYQRDFSFEDVEDAFEREEGKHADQILYSKGTEKRQKQMCARWEDGWRPNFGKPCEETFPIEKWCNNEKIKEIQKCLGLPADRRSGIFDDLTMSKLRAKGISPEESEDISEYEYKIICNKLSSKEQTPSDEIFESKVMKIKNQEKDEILRKHLDFKKILQEQKKFLERGLIMEQTIDEIESAKAQGCVSKVGKYAVRRSGSYQNQTAWVITATKETSKWKVDDDIWLYKNGDCEVFDQTDWKVITNCWACDKARVTTQTNTLEDYKRYGWLDINDEDLKVNFAQKDNPQFFIKMKVGGSPDGFLYFPVYKKNIVPENFPPESAQGKWIANIKQYYPNMVINPTQEEIDRLGLVEISVRGSETYFPFGLKIYYNKSAGKDYKAGGLEASKFRVNRQPSLVECEQAINGYWEDYVQKTEIDTQSTKFIEMKNYVQSCASQYYKNWRPRTLPDGTKEKLDGFAGIGTGKNILDKKLAALGGIEAYDGVPATTQYGSDRRINPWRITLPSRK